MLFYTYNQKHIKSSNKAMKPFVYCLVIFNVIFLFNFICSFFFFVSNFAFHLPLLFFLVQKKSNKVLLKKQENKTISFLDVLLFCERFTFKTQFILYIEHIK